MSFNGPPKPPQEAAPRVKTPEYWKENLPFKSPRKFYELEFKFAQIMAERTGISLVEAVDTYAPLIRNHIHTFNEEGDWGITGMEEGVTDENMLEYAWDRSLGRHTERNSEPAHYHREYETGARFGCSYYGYDTETKTVQIHFFNAEFEEEWVEGKDVSKGPLDKDRIERRRHELSEMFADIKKRFPDAEHVNGRSWLYSLDSEAYRRIYPPSYKAGEIVDDKELWGKGTTIWGQFLGGNNKSKGEYGFRDDLVAEFLLRAKELPPERIIEALPYPPRTAEGDIQDFYDFYGIT